MSPRFFELWASVDDCSLLPAACRFSEMDFKWAVIHHDGAPLQRPDANSYITMFVETNELHRGPHTGSRTHQHVGGDSCVSLKSVHLKNAYSSHVKSRPLSQWWCSAEVFWIFEYEFWFRPFAHTVFLFFSGLYLFFFFSSMGDFELLIRQDKQFEDAYIMKPHSIRTTHWFITRVQNRLEARLEIIVGCSTKPLCMRDSNKSVMLKVRTWDNLLESA